MLNEVKYFTFGTEHEFADWKWDTKLPEGYGRDVNDITIVNSNGIANDPSGKFYGYGGEINTPPTGTVAGQVECLSQLKKLLPEAKVNYRSNLHLHIRVPGLKDDLEALKQVQRYIHYSMPKAFPLIQNLPRPTHDEYSNIEEFKGALRRWRRRKVSHQTLLTPARVQRQLEATSIKEFFENEPPRSKDGKPLWHCQPRVCVNLRQLLETDTIEFRHFAGTLEEETLRQCFFWCTDFVLAALNNDPIEGILMQYDLRDFPEFPKYDHKLETRYRATVHDGTLDKNQIKENIAAILEGRFE